MDMHWMVASRTIFLDRFDRVIDPLGTAHFALKS